MSADIFTYADQLVRDSRGDLTRREALQELNRRAQLKRRAKHGLTRIGGRDRLAFANVEAPSGARFWWQND